MGIGWHSRAITPSPSQMPPRYALPPEGEEFRWCRAVAYVPHRVKHYTRLPTHRSTALRRSLLFGLPLFKPADTAAQFDQFQQ